MACGTQAQTCLEAAGRGWLGGAGLSGWLTYVEVARLEAICAWCGASAVCMAVLAVLATARLLRPVEARRSPARGAS